MTWTGIQPRNKKVEPIINMTPPTSTKHVRAFIGSVNYYRDMWARRLHLIQPLTALTSSKVRFKCSDVEQIVFDDIKKAVAHDTLLSYPYFNKKIDIHTDASDYQIGAVIIQEGKPIALYIHKLTGPQTQYMVTEK